MLAITADATEVIRKLTEAGVGALRISTAPHSQNGSGPVIRLELVRQPAAEDQIVQGDGVRVYVDPIAAPAVEDKLLDAEARGDVVEFALSERD